MIRTGTIALTALLMLSFSLAELQAQDPQQVTIREINTVPPNKLQMLKDGGASLTDAAIDTLVRSAYEGQTVSFTAVLLSDPLNSGLASPGDGGRPGRIHVFVRDTSAATMGNAGMSVQIVDPQFEATGLLTALPGEVMEVEGVVTYFGRTIQIDPISLTLVGTYADFDLPASILEPVTVSTGDLANVITEDDRIQIDWDNFANYNNEYVRFEDATVFTSNEWQAGRFNLDFSTDGGETRVGFDDISLRYRNDRPGYRDDFNKRTPEDPFIPPPPGAAVNVQGFLLFRGTVDPAEVTVPVGAYFRLAPWADDDMEVLESPPMITDIGRPATIPGDGPVSITANVEAGAGKTITDVFLRYVFSSNATDTGAVEMLNIGDETFSGDIPAAPNGDFVAYFVEAIDSENATSRSPIQRYRVLYDGITQIAHIQETATGGPGPSPFTGVTSDMSINAVVQSHPNVSGRIAIQDDSELNPWSGVEITATEALRVNLSQGDRINITRATVNTVFGVTFLQDIEYTKTAEGEPYPYKEVTTGLLQDPSVARAHLSMMVVFNEVEITDTNPDAPSDFGEWAFASVVNDQVQASVRADDLSEQIPSDFNTTEFSLGMRLPYHRGIWYFSFNNYKLIPETREDTAVDVSVEPIDGETPVAFDLHQNFPNPFNPSTSIQYDVPSAAHVTLEVFDVMGRRVATLVDEAMTPGSYQVRFDASALSSGVYLYRISAGDFQATKQMMFVK